MYEVGTNAVPVGYVRSTTHLKSSLKMEEVENIHVIAHLLRNLFCKKLINSGIVPYIIIINITKEPYKWLFLRKNTREGIRTPDLLVRSQTLYPTELLALILVGLQVFILATSSSLSKKDLFSSA